MLPHDEVERIACATRAITYALSGPGLTRYAYFPDQRHLQAPQVPARQARHPRSVLCLMLRPGIGSHRGLAFVSSLGPLATIVCGRYHGQLCALRLLNASDSEH
jgi:hypothetical protein